MAHDIELRRRPDPAPEAVPPQSPAAGAGAVLLRDCALGTEAARLEVAVLDPRRGVALVASGRPGALPALAGALRRRLDEARFGAVFPGHLPVVVLPAEAWAAQQAEGAPLAARLERAFADALPLSLPAGGAWMPSVARLLRSPPTAARPQGPATRAHRRRRTARVRWLAGGLGLGLLLIGSVAGLSEGGRVLRGEAPPRADGAAAPPPEPGIAAARPEAERAAAAPLVAGRPIASGREMPAAIDPPPRAAPGGGEPEARAAAARHEPDARAAAERQAAEARTAAERQEAEARVAAERQAAEARAAAERQAAERAARRAAAIDAALQARAEAARQSQQKEAEALRRAEAEAGWRRQQEAEAAQRAQEAARRAEQEARCRQVLALLRAGAFPAEADLAFFDRRCMPG